MKNTRILQSIVPTGTEPAKVNLREAVELLTRGIASGNMAMVREAAKRLRFIVKWSDEIEIH
jgi:hypothetical protein